MLWILSLGLSASKNNLIPIIIIIINNFLSTPPVQLIQAVLLDLLPNFNLNFNLIITNNHKIKIKKNASTFSWMKMISPLLLLDTTKTNTTTITNTIHPPPNNHPSTTTLLTHQPPQPAPPPPLRHRSPTMAFLPPTTNNPPIQTSTTPTHHLVMSPWNSPILSQPTLGLPTYYSTPPAPSPIKTSPGCSS